MIFKVIYLEEDDKGNFPVKSTMIEECDKIFWTEENGILEFNLMNTSNETGNNYKFSINVENDRQIIYIENDNGRTIEKFVTYRK